MSHNLLNVNTEESSVTGAVTVADTETMLSEAAPNSTPTGSTFNYAVGNYYRWAGTQSTVNSSYVTDHADGTYTLQAGTYFIQCCVSFQKTWTASAKSDWRFYDQTNSQYIGAGLGAHVDYYYANDPASCSCAQIFQFDSATRIGLRLITIITGTFTNSNQDSDSPAYLIMTRL
jgi:hypothetical protein